MTKARIPLQVPLSTRNETADKDGEIVNGFVEQSPSKTLLTVKRPGIQVEVSGLNGNNGQGMFFYDPSGNGGNTGEGVVYHWNAGTALGTTPSTIELPELPTINDDNTYEHMTAALTGSGFYTSTVLSRLYTVTYSFTYDDPACGGGHSYTPSLPTKPGSYSGQGATKELAAQAARDAILAAVPASYTYTGPVCNNTYDYNRIEVSSGTFGGNLISYNSYLFVYDATFSGGAPTETYTFYGQVTSIS
jgi:hypothetical protein